MQIFSFFLNPAIERNDLQTATFLPSYMIDSCCQFKRFPWNRRVPLEAVFMCLTVTSYNLAHSCGFRQFEP